MSIERSTIIEAARSYVGVPFLHQGRERTGMDCIGLVWAVASDLGLSYENFPKHYSPLPAGQRIVERAEDYLVKPERQGWDNLIPGDVVVLWGTQAGVPQHFAFIGTMFGKLTMIHAFQKAGKVIEHNTMQFWGDRYVATFCIPDTEKLEG